MRLLVSGVPVLILIACAVSAAGDDLKSPDGQYVIHNPDGQDVADKVWEKQSTSITRGGDTIWSYASYNKARQFFWAPDSARILIVQPTGDGDVQAYVLDIERESGDLTRFDQVALGQIHDEMLKEYPLRQGGGAPRSRIGNVRWLSATECEFRFFDNGEGFDAEALVKITCSTTGGMPGITVEQVTDHFKKHAE